MIRNHLPSLPPLPFLLPPPPPLEPDSQIKCHVVYGLRNKVNVDIVKDGRGRRGVVGRVRFDFQNPSPARVSLRN